MIKDIIKKMLGEKILKYYSAYRITQQLKKNFIKDFVLYKEYSTLLSNNSYKQKEALITFNYHSIEKGFLYESIRYRFAQKKITELLNDLKSIDIFKANEKVQIQAALINLKNYYEFHEGHKQDISDYFPVEDYLWIKKHVTKNYPSTIVQSRVNYFSKNDCDFKEFSMTRHSVRSYNGEIIPENILKQVIKLANNAPSVCNRQSVSVIVLENKEIIDQIIEIQGGLKGFSDNLRQIMIITSDRSCFYSIGERNQLYIDGGIYLMNLLYALHYYKIAACPAHWAMPIEADKKLEKILNLSQSLKIICVIGIGIPEENFPITLSLKRTEEENLTIIR